MGNIKVQVNNLSAGELSPALSARTDIAQYRNGAREMLNMIPLIEGGSKRRDGTIYREMFDVEKARLIPFVVSTDAAFLLAFLPSELRVYDANTGDGVATLTTYFDETTINKIKYVQNRYSIWFVCGDRPVYWLRCSTDFTAWSIEEFVFDVPPLAEGENIPDAGLKPDGVDFGTLITLTATSLPAWLNGKPYFVGDEVWHNGQAWICVVDNTNKQPGVDVGSGPGGSPFNFWNPTDGGIANIFDESVIGSLVFINSGVVRITEFITENQIRGEVIKKLSADVQAIPKSWSLKSTAFTDEQGHPKTVTFFKQRLVFGNTKTYPNAVWFSRVGDIRNFLPTDDDADSIYVSTSSDQRDEILHLAQSRSGVVAFTGGSEFSIGSDSTLTPATVRIIEHTYYGCDGYVRPCRVGTELLFIQRGGARCRAMAYRFDADGLVAPDISTLSKHLADNHGGIVEMTYQQEPHSIVWCVLGDGKVASLTLNREQEVIAWALHDFGGQVISMCAVVGNVAYDKVFMLVKRQQGGDDVDLILEQMAEGLRVDCATQAWFDAEVKTNHVAAGRYGDLTAYFGNQVIPILHYEVEGGATLEAEVEGIYTLGLNFTSRLDLFPPELAQPPQTTRINKIKCDRISFALTNTPTLKYNGRLIELLTFDDPVLSPIAEGAGFTGLYGEDVGAWVDVNKFKTTIEQDLPLPLYVQSVIFDLQMNDR